MKCLVFAYSQLGYDCLKYMLDHTQHSVVALVTHKDSPSEHIWFDSVSELAHYHDIPVYTPTSLKDKHIQDELLAYTPDVILSFYYRNMIPTTILNVPPLGAFNMHGSLLPKYRGRCPVNWAILHGETETGVTLHAMVQAPDAGAIADQESIMIDTKDTAGMVMDKMCKSAVSILARSLDKIEKQTIILTEQNTSYATYFGGRTAADGEINWHWPALQIYNLVRALQPQPQYPAAYGIIDNTTYHVKTCSLLPSIESDKQTPGTILCHNTNDNTFTIACGHNGTDRVFISYEMADVQGL